MGIIQGRKREQANNRYQVPRKLANRCPRLPFRWLQFSFAPKTPSLCTKGSIANFPFFVSSDTSFVASKGTFLDVESTVGHVGSHLLQLEFLGELLVELLELGDELTTGLDNGGLGSDLAVGVDTELERGEERVRDFVGGEGDVLHAEQLVAQHVSKGVVLLVEGEESGVGDL